MSETGDYCMKKPFVIAIDGPAASGKGTLARKLAAHFSMPYLDTGKLYRAVGLKLLNQGANPQDVEKAAEAARTLSVECLASPLLADERAGKAASQVAAIPLVREILLDFQRNFAANPEGAVMDGRDIGTVICPDAQVKFFIHADVHARAERRYQELCAKAVNTAYDTVLKELQERDARDSSRSVAPLVAASDAIVVDTTAMDADQVLAHVLALISAVKH